MLVEDFATEPVEGPVGLVAEVRFAPLGDGLDGRLRNTGLGRLVRVGVGVRVPGVPRVPVPVGHREREFTQVLGQAAVEAGERAEGLGTFAHPRAVQPDPERPADGTTPACDPGGRLLLTRSFPHR
ncbi:hypothetical protein [Streptomyces shenzhenensis]|uniref:hypothetical protein n=1 Tax=Streptomyces shenzhenensis TaxID=943815 RepID=UPI0015F05A79|nr:hypothetical protein [Streptomyces shenzhenensis]